MPALVRLTNVVQPYAWGSTTAIPELLGVDPTGEPQAELWLGTHPKGPSRLGDETLADVIAADPTATLGPAVAATYGDQLPFLLKVLAAAEPLSLQAHPSPEQAAEGFERENGAGVPLDAPHRNYRDRNHKPELICPLGSFTALCGFRPPAVTVELLERLAVPGLAPVIERLRHGDVRSAVEYLLTLVDPGPLVADVGAACRRSWSDGGGRFSLECRWGARLADQHPGDAGVVTALLLNCVELRPDEAVELPAGNLHAYLEGVGVEVMANSDNVLRGGLTPKHVDTAELVRVLDWTPMDVVPLLPRLVAPGVEVWDSSAAEFRLSRLRPGGASVAIETQGPEILLVVEGRVVAGDITLAQGESAFVPAAAGRYEVTGSGTVYRATAA